jgi:hypothetical protein
LSGGKTDSEILVVLDKEFPPGSNSTSNKQALAGTKWDLQRSVTRVIRERSIPSSRSVQLTNSQLVAKLREFHSPPIIERYRLRDLAGKSSRNLLKFMVDRTIYRAFHYETPSLRYAQWRWHGCAEQLRKELDAISDQKTFDCFPLELGESLVADWGTKNDRGEPSKMNIGVAMKIANLALKHFSFSDLSRNPRLIEWLHVPWDSFTLRPLREIWAGHPSIPNAPSQGFVKNLAMYQQLHSLISDIAQEAGVARISYEFWAWDTPH